MNKYELISDGSYHDKSQTIGMGWVIIPDESEICVFSKKLDQSVHEIPIRHRSLAAEVLAAICALNSLPVNSHINLFSDNNVIPDFVNGHRTYFIKHELSNLFQALAAHTQKHSIKGFWKNEMRGKFDRKMNVYFAIAHNASAVASGSGKRVETDGYFGDFNHNPDAGFLLRQEKIRQAREERSNNSLDIINVSNDFDPRFTP